MAGPGFSGFPDGRLQATVIPSLFFRELLGQIDDVAELKVILYVFWRLGQKRGYPRYVTRRELEGDPAIRAGLAGLASNALSVALDGLVARKALIHRTIELNGTVDEWYFVNAASGRKAVRDLESGAIDLGQIVTPEPTTERPERASIFELYEQNVGLLTPLIVDELRDAERQYPGDWIEEAFRQAVAYNRRSWRYVQRILERWAVEGKRVETTGRRPSRTSHPAPNRAGR